MADNNKLYRIVDSSVSFLFRMAYSSILFLIFIGDCLRLFTSRLLVLFISLITVFYQAFIALLSLGIATLKKFIIVLEKIFKAVKKSGISSLDNSITIISNIKFTKPVKEKAITIYPNKVTNKHHKIRRVFLRRHALLTGFLIGLLTAGFFYFINSSYLFVRSLPNPSLIGTVNFPVSTKIMDRNGVLLYEVFREENRTPIKRNQIPSYIINATIATEDKEFYNHNGISFYGGVLRAFKEMFVAGKIQGGSSITQQLVKTSLLSPERTLERKIKEALLAIWVERMYSKEQILEMYLNQVSYGGSAYGIEEAAKTYFGKSAGEISLSEAAFLAGLPQAPSYYSPYVNPDLARRRRDDVLRAMLEESYITTVQYNDALKSPLTIKPPKSVIKAPHFVFYVKTLLEEKLGTKRVEEGGLRVYTSLDIRLQEEVESI